jgi:hypothetical protein
VAEKKFSVSPVPSATVGKAFANGLIAFAESFRLSAKPGFPVVHNQNQTDWSYTAATGVVNFCLLSS